MFTLAAEGWTTQAWNIQYLLKNFLCILLAARAAGCSQLTIAMMALIECPELWLVIIICTLTAVGCRLPATTAYSWAGYTQDTRLREAG